MADTHHYALYFEKEERTEVHGHVPVHSVEKKVYRLCVKTGETDILQDGKWKRIQNAKRG